MIDTTTLLKSVDLVALIERDTEKAKNGRVFCPICQTTHHGGPAMSIKDNHYFCFGCGANGDAIDYIIQRNRVDFIGACKILGWGGKMTDPAECKKAIQERKERQSENDKIQNERIEKLRAEYSASEIWLANNRNMQQINIEWWESQGIPKDWQDYLKLGFTTDKPYKDRDGTLRHSPAYVIPYFHYGFEFINTQYRLVDPVNPKDRYRFEYGLKTTYYMTTPGLPITSNVIICEGAKKAIVSAIMGATGNDVTVLGVPAKMDHGDVAKAIDGCAHAWLVFDPDAWNKPENAPFTWEPAPNKLAREIGKAARIVRLPIKCDDMFIQYGMTSRDWKRTLKQARGL